MLTKPVASKKVRFHDHQSCRADEELALWRGDAEGDVDEDICSRGC